MLYLDFSNHPDHKNNNLFIISVCIITFAIISSLINVISKNKNMIKS